jgi:dTMP kinase
MRYARRLAWHGLIKRETTVTGLFVSFEGIDGAGKSSHIASVAKAFAEQGREVVTTREPGGTPLAEQLRGHLLGEGMDPLTEALLVFAARQDHLQQVVRPALARGAVVLSDRFTDATFAYQGAGRGFNEQVLDTLEQWVQQGLQPHLTFWFDLDPEVAAQRRAQARAADRFEAEPLAFFERVRQGYAKRAQQAPQRVVRLDAGQPKHRVWQQLTQILVQRGYLAIMVAATGPTSA